ncbi:MAG: hypothetical protein OXE40_03735 [Gammaproteobacteria bacterium]|nr:hypothetical protein [Gammaproteobacteria bacterium]
MFHERTHAPFDNIIWNTWFTANSEESVVTTPQGNPVVVAIHGGGVLGTPQRFEQSLYADMDHRNEEGLTGEGAAKLTRQEARDVLEGSLPDGTEIPVYPYSEFRRGIDDLPRRYAVVLDFELARKTEKGFTPFEVLKEEPNFIVRAGGVEAAAAYLEKARKRNDTGRMQVSHRHNAIYPTQPQTRLLTLGGNRGGVGSEGHEGLSWGYGEDWGLSASGPVDMGRYIAVAPRDASSGVQYLDFGI